MVKGVPIFKHIKASLLSLKYEHVDFTLRQLVKKLLTEEQMV